ncbi:MAG: hypothetical protein WBX18_07100, partial [Terracidiphilus sp.]
LTVSWSGATVAVAMVSPNFRSIVLFRLPFRRRGHKSLSAPFNLMPVEAGRSQRERGGGKTLQFRLIGREKAPKYPKKEWKAEI